MARKSREDIEHEASIKRAFPKITRIAVISMDPLNSSHLLDLERVSYITTRNAIIDNDAAIAKEQEANKTSAAKKPATNKISAPDKSKGKQSAANAKDTSGEIVFVCRDGSEYSNYSSLKELEEKLEINQGNVWFMRTSNSHIINLREVVEIRINNARDLFFKNIEDRVINAVTRTYLEKFKACPNFLG